MRSAVVVAFALVGACSSKKDPPAPPPVAVEKDAAPAPLAETPLAVRFGACASPTQAFVAGPPAGDPNDSRYGFGPTDGPDGCGQWERGSSRAIAGHPEVSVDRVFIALRPQTMTGALEAPIVRRYMKRHLQAIGDCYEKELLTKPKLAGTVTATFVIGANGVVTTSTASGVDQVVSTCMADVIKAIDFPRPKSGDVSVSYPIEVAPTVPVGEPGGPEIPEPNNTLETAQDALTACFRQMPVPYGAAVIELAYDAEGKVASSKVHGLDSAAVVSCIDAAVKPLTRRRATQDAGERCAVAFGTLPLSVLPKVELTDKVVEPRAPAPAAENDDVLTFEWPYLVMPAATTPMGAVNATEEALRSNEHDFMLARPDGTLLSPAVLPAPPAPLGSCPHWHRLAPRKPPPAGIIWTYLTASTIAIDVEPLHTVKTVDAATDGALVEALDGVYLSQQYAPLVLAAAPDVPYASFVRVVDAFDAHAYTKWVHSSPSALPATVPK